MGEGVANFEARSSSTTNGRPRKRRMPPMIQDHTMHGNGNFFNGEGVGNSQAGPSNQSQPANENMGPPNYEEVRTLPFWPPLPRPFFCSCCQVLRQMVHINGSKIEKLEIHGTIGVISHAIIQNQHNTPGGPSSDAHQMIDFCHRDAQYIKTFLVQYCAQQSALGCIIVEDPMSAYYETLCTGLDWTEDFSGEDDDLIPPNDMEQEPEPEKTSTSKRKRGKKRKKIVKMTLSDLSGVFYLPVEAVAEQLGVCVTFVKNICRNADLDRWPQRKVSSLRRKFAKLKRALDSPDPGTRDKN
ncbi:NLP6 protein [Spatholobus suberectus]|nr:NLP6 protein [Spatholobus suberectus]